jgi:hypothetical protein
VGGKMAVIVMGGIFLIIACVVTGIFEGITK